MGRVTDRSDSVKAVTVIVKSPYQNQRSAYQGNRESKLQTRIRDMFFHVFPESSGSHSKYKIIQRRAYLTFIYKEDREVRNTHGVKITDNYDPGYNCKQNGYNGRYKPVFPDCLIKEGCDKIKLKNHTHGP